MTRPQTESTRFLPLRYRQVHLDFHTSEAIPDVGRDFDAHKFTQTLVAANVDSITLFARCHHGWCYYPSDVGDSHPQLARPDLLGEMIKACKAVDIETPIYITAQWDENLARKHPEWRVVSASNQAQSVCVDDHSAMNQLSPAWHTLCLNHSGYRQYLIDMGIELVDRYAPPGLFYDIVISHQCVCQACLKNMHDNGLDPRLEEHRLINDQAVNEQFRQQLSDAIWGHSSNVRVFYNAGHINKQCASIYNKYSHLEIESLPTGGWGYNHFPSSARYAAALGMDFLGQTGKFHTSWGEFGGYKQSDALQYECAQMVALGAKCLIGDQLHPNGVINPDTYRYIAPAYSHIRKIEPYLVGAKQLSDIAILAVESTKTQVSGRNHVSDDGAVQMLLEMHLPFDVIDTSMNFDKYRLLILPDDLPVDEALSQSLNTFVSNAGKILFSSKSGRDPVTGSLRLEAGIELGDSEIESLPSYLRVIAPVFGEKTPSEPLVMYGQAESIRADGAKVLAECLPSYFNRNYLHFCSHQHSPDDVGAKPAGPAVTVSDDFGYIAYPIFQMYHATGQPIYRYLVAGLLQQLLSGFALQTSLPSAGRASLNWQAEEHRLIIHLLYGAPQVRGRASPSFDAAGPVEMIEDIPVLADVHVSARVAVAPIRVYDVVTAENIDFQYKAGRVELTLPRLHIHAVIVLEFSETFTTP